MDRNTIRIRKCIILKLFKKLWSTRFFISNTKSQAKAKQHIEVEFLPFENYSLSTSLFSSKSNLRYSKKCAKSKCIRFYQAIWLIAMKMRLKMKYGSHRHDINRTWLRHKLKHTLHKMCLSMIMVLRNKQHLSNFWSWIHEKVKQHWGWVEKMCCL